MTRNEAIRRNSEEIMCRFTRLTAATTWQRVAEISLTFPTGHPQGLVKIGEFLYISSVEITSPPQKLPSPENGYDRTAGEGAGFLFQVDSNGNLVEKLSLGENSMYHPGGIDYDGRHIWVPVAEYRPNSRSIVYRVTPETLNAREMFRWDDHIGGLACNRWNNRLHGISWGSRAFYDWKFAGVSPWEGEPSEPTGKCFLNGSFYIDYQDCQFLEPHYMLCCGLNVYTLPKIGIVPIGGLELVDIESHVAIHQIPVPLYSGTLRPMTQNPFFVELHRDCLRFSFLPDDNESTVYVYDALF